MSTTEIRGEYLENGTGSGLEPDDRSRLDEVRSALADPITWAQPPDRVGDEIRSATVIEQPARSRRQIWAAAAVLALIGGVVGIIQLTAEESTRPSVVATISMAGTELASGATGTAGLVPTPNGWAIDFEVSGLPPAAAGTYYQAWVDNGVDSVSVGSFHMRGDRPTSIGLWSGVDLHDYRTLNVTLESEGEGHQSGPLVMTGTTPEFD